MNLKRTIPAIAGLVLGLATVVWACDGWREIEHKNKRYDTLDLTSEQKAQIEALKQKAVASFRDDHKHGGCDDKHEQTMARFITEADGVLTSAQRMEVRTGERLASMESELKALREEIKELKSLIRELAKK